MRNTRYIATFLTVAIFTFVSSPFALAQKAEIREVGKSILIQDDLRPAAIQFDGNPNCADLNASTDIRFAHITTGFELKLDFGSPGGPLGESFAFEQNTSNPAKKRLISQGPGEDPAPQYPDFDVFVSTTNPNVFNWFSGDVKITAVIVKGGNGGANVYPYNPASNGGNPDGFGLVTPNNRNGGVAAISHVSFCYQVVVFDPSAATVEVSGQVLDAEGRAIRGAMVEVWNVSRDEYKYAQTNNFGFYTVAELLVGDFYIVTARHGRHVFGDNGRSFTLEDAVSDLNFVATNK